MTPTEDDVARLTKQVAMLLRALTAAKAENAALRKLLLEEVEVEVAQP